MPWGVARRIAELYQAKVNALPARAEGFGRDALACRGDDCSCGRPWLPGQAELRAEHRAARQTDVEV